MVTSNVKFVASTAMMQVLWLLARSGSSYEVSNTAKELRALGEEGLVVIVY